MERNEILIEIYNDEFYKGYIRKLAPENKVEEFHSYFLLTMSEICATKLEMLHELKQLKYYAVAIIRNELFNKISPYNKLEGVQHANIDDFYSLTSEDELEISQDHEQIKTLLDDVYKFMERRTDRVGGAWYDEKLFKLFYEGNETYRSLADKTDIHYCSIFNSIKGTKEIINTKFKERYDNL